MNCLREMIVSKIGVPCRLRWVWTRIGRDGLFGSGRLLLTMVDIGDNAWHQNTRAKHNLPPPATKPNSGRPPIILRGSMDAAEYKHVVLGLIFLKYISDAFEELHTRLEAEQSDGADPEDPDEYRAENVFWVPPEARWTHLKAQARQPTIGQFVDAAMAGIERDNPVLKDVLPKEYARPALDKQRLGQLIDLISNIKVGDQEAHSKDVLGRVYENFLSRFASAEGKKGGEFLHTPLCRQGAGRDAGALPRAGLRSLLRLLRECSCSRSRSFAPTPAETATAARHAATSRSTGRSRTTRRGGSRR